MIWNILFIIIGTVLIIFEAKQNTEDQSKGVLFIGIMFLIIGGIMTGMEINQCQKFGIGIPINIQQNIPPWR
jgi:membrane-bound ClpP family serine protease